MKKIIFSTIVLSILFIAACSKVDDIRGIWKITDFRYNYYNANNNLLYSKSNDIIKQAQFRFSDTELYFCDDDGYELSDLGFVGNYRLNTKINPMTLITVKGKDSLTYTILSLTSTQMILQQQPFNGGGYNDTVTKQYVQVNHSALIITLKKQNIRE